MKSLEKDRHRRYDSPTSFAADIERFLKHEAVLACPPTAGYRLRKFVARRKALFVTATTIAVALLLGIVGTSGGMFWALGERGKAKEQTQLADQVADHEMCRLNEEELRWSLDRQLHVYATNAALQGWEQHNLTRVEALLRQCARAARGGDPREFPWYYLWKGLNRIRETPAIPVADFAWTLAFQPDGKRLAAVHSRGGLFRFGRQQS